MMKIIRILEMAWLLIAIAGIMMGSYKFSKGDTEEALYFLVFTLVAGIFYYIRRRQRIKMDKERDTNN